MRRALLVLVTVLVGFTVAQGLRSLAVPNVFESGMKMSAAAMNENLESLWARTDEVRYSVIATRRTQVELRNRVRALAPADAPLAASGFENRVVTLQVDDELPWPFKAGEVVDAGAVNESFDRFATGFAAIDEFDALLVRDMEAIAAQIGALEEALGLSSGARADANLEPFVAPEINAFTKNQLIVPTEVNQNFGRLDVALVGLEGNAAELAAWVEHEVQRFNAVEAIAGPPVLAESDYLLPVRGQLDWEDYSDGTEIEVLAASEVFATGGYQLRRYPGGRFDLSSGGAYDLTIDARILGDSEFALPPEALAEWYLTVYDELTDSRTFSISNPGATIKWLNFMQVIQRDDTGAPWGSHEIYFVHDDGTFPVDGDLFFSDRPVTISGTLFSTDRNYTEELDVSLEAGWNLVYPTHVTDRTVYRSRPMTTGDTPDYRLRTITLARGYAPEVYGYSFFAAHQLDGDGVPTAFLSAIHGWENWPLSVDGPMWLNHNMAALTLVPIDQVVPNASGPITSNFPEARYMLVHVYGYDRDTVDAGELGVLARSRNQIVATSPAGNAIWLVYTNQTSTIHADFTDTGGSGDSFKTEAEGLSLRFGWNHIESVPSGDDDGSYVLIRYTDDLPSLVAIPH